ncbi:MAG: lysine--tRNA ligase [Alphaproteobacteria bacterium]
MSETAASLRELATAGRAWPFEEARRVLTRIENRVPAKGHVLFETGYGPSGLPHIGTFGEVVRTTMVRHAFAILSDIPTRLYCFSDDMDGLRKVPDNVPNHDMLKRYVERKNSLGQITHHPTPLTSVPDPFGTHPSFGQHNNARLRAFLDRFGFTYEFKSATECYQSGMFNDVLRRVLEKFDAVRDVVLPTLGPDRRRTYSPIFPIIDINEDGLARRIVLHNVQLVGADLANGLATFQPLDLNGDPEGKPFQHSILNGRCKLQWKVDWAMRWTALGVDYEMSGKDLIDSVKLSSQICRVLGGRPPENLTYELFLDEQGRKISKSKGNGLTVDEWLRYASPESLSLFMYQKPKAAKRLYFDVIPRQVDDYLAFLSRYPGEETPARIENPVWHIHSGSPPAWQTDVSFALLLNLIGACHSEDKAVAWGFVARHIPGARPETRPELDRMIGYAINYYTDFVKPTRSFRAPSETERRAMEDLIGGLEKLPAGTDAEAIQTEVYETGKRHGFANLRDWFKALYEVLLGQSQGPRFGSFVALYGIPETVALMRRALAGQDLSRD